MRLQASLKKPKIVLMAFFAIIALVILIDFSFPGRKSIDKVIDIHKTVQNYYNAAGNYHYSYKIQTIYHNFLVSESLAIATKKGQELEIKVSPIFNKVNTVKVIVTGIKEIYSLRIFSGLIVPILGLVIFTIGYKLKEKVSTLVFVFEVLQIADLIYLLN